MVGINRQTTRPLDMPRSIRRHRTRALTSLPAGRVVPLMAAPLLREDSVRSGKIRVSAEMMETAELLMNGVYFDVKAYLVPWLAFARFNGSMDILNKSYMAVAPYPAQAVIPFFDSHAMGAHGTKPIYKYMGLHAKSTTNVNTAYAEAYNAIWNYRAKNRSPNIPLRTALDTSLAPAFWKHENFAHIVPDFDQAVIDGQVALNVVNSQLPVKGLAIFAQGSIAAQSSLTETGGTVGGTSYSRGWQASDAAASNGIAGRAKLVLKENGSGVPAVYAEMAANGITISLSNIEMAKKTQAFARLREQFSELDDVWLIDMLMQGLAIPDQALKDPMLLAEKTTMFGMSKRYATDAANLDEAAVNGATFVDLNIHMPRLETGGIIMVTAEITPEQLFERKKDYFFHTTTVAALPEALRDTLDPEKVEVVTNDYVDTDHATPSGTFGYAPLNHAWDVMEYKIGGKFHRPTANTVTDDDRQRIWSVETVNPVLSADFYLATTMHQKPFLDTAADPFEAVTMADLDIEGLTVFGGALVESLGNYTAVTAKQPTTRIVKP